MLYKLFIYVFVFSLLVVIRELWAFVKAVYWGEKNNIPTNRMIILGLSISYIITIIITGFKI